MPDIEAKSQIISTNEDTQGDLAIIDKKLYDEQNYEQALKVYSDMLLYTSDSELYVKMGNCFEKLDKGATAVEYWEKAIEVEPMNSNAFINLGNYYYKKNKIEKAISYWLASLLSMPEEPTSNLNLAIAYSLKNMQLEAFLYYDRYLKYAQDKTSEKYLTIKKKIEKNKKLGNDYLKLGVQYQNFGDKLSALKCYSRAVQYCPIFSKIHLNLGSLYYADKNYEEAVKYWATALYLDPYYPKILNNLAITYDILQKFDYAYCYYTRYNTLIVNNPVESDKITSRCHKIKPILNANPYLVANHIDHAKQAFAECDYFRALNEFKNYIILEPSEFDNYNEFIIKIEKYIHPEMAVIESCLMKGKKLISEENNFSDAKQYYARVLVLAEQDSPEYTEAKKRLGICIQHSL